MASACYSKQPFQIISPPNLSDPIQLYTPSRTLRSYPDTRTFQALKRNNKILEAPLPTYVRPVTLTYFSPRSVILQGSNLLSLDTRISEIFSVLKY